MRQPPGDPKNGQQVAAQISPPSPLDPAAVAFRSAVPRLFLCLLRGMPVPWTGVGYGGWLSRISSLCAQRPQAAAATATAQAMSPHLWWLTRATGSVAQRGPHGRSVFGRTFRKPEGADSSQGLALGTEELALPFTAWSGWTLTSRPPSLPTGAWPGHCLPPTP